MYLKRYQQYSLKNNQSQQGSMLVIALFVIIVFALLGLAMTRLLSASSDTIIHEVLGQRALNAARAGIECAIAETFKTDPSTTVCAQNLSHTFNGVPGLDNCNYTASSPTSKAIDDGVNTYTYLAFTSTGQCTAGNINVTRVIFVDVMN